MVKDRDARPALPRPALAPGKMAAPNCPSPVNFKTAPPCPENAPSLTVALPCREEFAPAPPRPNPKKFSSALPRPAQKQKNAALSIPDKRREGVRGLPTFKQQCPIRADRRRQEERG